MVMLVAAVNHKKGWAVDLPDSLAKGLQAHCVYAHRFTTVSWGMQIHHTGMDLLMCLALSEGRLQELNM